ncbi:MAG: hypothetical protein RJQ21_17435 [Rhodospirillales bacterium]
MKPTIALFFILALAACNRTTGDVYVPGVPQALSNVAGQGDMPVEISGTLFGMDQAAFDAAATTAMRGRNFGPVFNYSTSPAEGSTENYKVRMLVGAPVNLSHIGLCEPAVMPAPVKQDAGETKIVTAFCYKDTVQSGATSFHTPGSGPESVEFQRMINAMLTTMFPLEDPFRDDGCGNNLVNC